MSAEPLTAEVPDRVSSLAMIRTLGGVAALAGLLVVFAFEGTKGRIDQNRREAIERAVFRVLPGAVTRGSFAMVGETVVRDDAEQSSGEHVYAGYDGEGKLVGVAIEAEGQGYQDVIRLLYGYSFENECITGIAILQMTETPGLGDRIGKDPDFLENFDALECRLNAEGTGLENPIVAVPHGTKTSAWEIDGISGATISTKAVGSMLNESAQRLAPILNRHAETFRGGS